MVFRSNAKKSTCLQVHEYRYAKKLYFIYMYIIVSLGDSKIGGYWLYAGEKQLYKFRDGGICWGPLQQLQAMFDNF